MMDNFRSSRSRARQYYAQKDQDTYTRLLRELAAKDVIIDELREKLAKALMAANDQ